MSQEPIAIEKRTYESISYTHDHNFSQLILPLCGELSIKTENTEFKLDDKHLFFLPPQKVHTFFSRKKNQFLVLDIPNWVLPIYKEQRSNAELYQDMDKSWESLRFLFLQEINSGKLDELAVIDLIRYATHFLKNEKNPVSIEYMHNNFDEKISLEKLASIENFNPTYYSQWFKKKTGYSPITYLQRIRIEKAKNYLSNKKFSILEIAQMVGYDDQASLTRLFNRYEGMSPLQFRIKQRSVKKQ